MEQGERPSRSFSSIADALRHVLARAGPTDPGNVLAALAVAGPVRAGRTRLTNLGWVVAGEELRKRLGLGAVAVLNDVQAAALAVRDLAPDGWRPLWDGASGDGPAQRGARDLLVLVGTGLGAATVDERRAWPSEAGHLRFAPRSDLQREFVGWLLDEGVFPSLEHVAAGPALWRWYRFLEQAGVERADPRLAERLRNAEDPAAEVGRAAVAGRCPLAERAVREALAALGHGLRDLLLVTLPDGVLYLGGGVAARLAPLLTTTEDLLGALHADEPLAEQVRAVPVRLLLAEDLGLVGALNAARRLADEPE